MLAACVVVITGFPSFAVVHSSTCVLVTTCETSGRVNALLIASVHLVVMMMFTATSRLQRARFTESRWSVRTFTRPPQTRFTGPTSFTTLHVLDARKFAVSVWHSRRDWHGRSRSTQTSQLPTSKPTLSCDHGLMLYGCAIAMAKDNTP